MGKLKLDLPGKLEAATARPPGGTDAAPPDAADAPPAAADEPPAGEPPPVKLQIPPKGWQEATARLQAEQDALRQARSALEQAVGQLGQLHQQALRQAEQQLAALAVAIARKILHQEIEGGRYRMQPVVAAAVKRLGSRREVVVHLHPDDLSRCTGARPDGTGDDGGGLRFLPDPEVPPGGCRVEGAEGVVAADAEAELREIAEALERVE